MVVFPVPGPPVITIIPLDMDSSIASLCFFAKMIPSSPSMVAMAFSIFISIESNSTLDSSTIFLATLFSAI